VYYKLSNAFIFVVDLLKPESVEFIKNILKDLLYYTATFAMIALNYDEKQNHDVVQFCEDYKIYFIPLEDFSFFREDNYILENLLGLCLVKKIKKSSKKKKKVKQDDKKEKDECSYLSNYKIQEEDEEKEKSPSSDIFTPCKVYRKYSGKC